MKETCDYGSLRRLKTSLHFLSTLIKLVILIVIIIIMILRIPYRATSGHKTEITPSVQAITGHIEGVRKEREAKEEEYYNKRVDAIVQATHNIETGFGRFGNPWLYHNNPGGMVNYYTGEYESYETPEEGFKDLRRLIETKYIPEFGFDLVAIRQEYCHQCGQQDLETFIYLYEEEMKS